MNKQQIWNIGYFVAAFLLLMLFQNMWTTYQTVEPIPYSEFLKLSNEGQIVEVTVNNEQITGKLILSAAFLSGSRGRDCMQTAPRPRLQFDAEAGDRAARSRLGRQSGWPRRQPPPGWLSEHTGHEAVRAGDLLRIQAGDIEKPIGADVDDGEVGVQHAPRHAMASVRRRGWPGARADQRSRAVALCPAAAACV